MFSTIKEYSDRLTQNDYTLKKLELNAYNPEKAITSEELGEVAVSLKINTFVTQIYLQYNSLTDISSLTKALETNRSVILLNLASNDLGDVAAKLLSDVIKVNSCIKILILSNNKIGNTGASTLANVLKQNKTLRFLYLRGNEIGPNGAKDLAEMLTCNFSISLAAESCMFGPGLFGDDKGEEIQKSLKQVGQQLHIDFNPIENEGLVYFSQMLQKNQFIEEANFFRGKYGDSGVDALSKMLVENASLKSIEIGGSFTSFVTGAKYEVTDQGISALANALMKNRTLKELLLFKVTCSSIGASALGSMLKINTSLMYLRLKDVQLNPLGMEALAEGLKENQTLKKLDISDNQIGDQGATIFADIIKKNVYLKDLILQSNSICMSGAEKLAEAVEENTTLESLDLRFNYIEDELEKKINDKIEKNKGISKGSQEEEKKDQEPITPESSFSQKTIPFSLLISEEGQKIALKSFNEKIQNVLNDHILFLITRQEKCILLEYENLEEENLFVELYEYLIDLFDHHSIEDCDLKDSILHITSRTSFAARQLEHFFRKSIMKFKN